MEDRVADYFAALARMPMDAQVADRGGQPMSLAEAIAWWVDTARSTHAGGDKLMFIGNGGSASIASHMAIDYSKHGNLRATAFNDAAALTCLGNDLGYENVFASQIEMHGRAGDLLIAISSSGNSPNIHRGVRAARSLGAKVLTMSGFSPDNPLRGMGDVNLYVPSSEYGFVEITHLAFCHATLDLAMGWLGESGEEDAPRRRAGAAGL